MSAKAYITLVIEITGPQERDAVHRANEVDSAISALLRGSDNASVLSSAYHPSLKRSVQVVAEDIERHVE